MPRALITGITGQDGQYLAEFLHGKGYEVFGLVKGQNNPKGDLIQTELPYVELVPGDLQDLPSLVTALEYTQPDEVYNLAGDLVRGAVVQPGRADRQRHRPRRAAHARGDPHGGRDAEQPDPLLPGVVVGDVRQGARDAADGADPVPSPLAVRRAPRSSATTSRSTTASRYGLFACIGHPVQPRGRAAGHGVRHPQGHQRRWPASSSACRTSSSSATSTPSGTGATPATTSRRCG